MDVRRGLLGTLPMREPQAVHPITFAGVRQAHECIAAAIVRTTLVRLDLGPRPDLPNVGRKLENLQATNSYELRGAVNAVAMMSEGERRPTSGSAWPVPRDRPARPEVGRRVDSHRNGQHGPACAARLRRPRAPGWTTPGGRRLP